MLTVHLGLHKTGSTALQTVLGISLGHIRRRQRYLRWTDLFVTDGTINYRGAKRVAALSENGWHVVVSSEGGLGSLRSMYDQAGQVTRELSELFGPENLQIVVYVRPQHSWCESAYTQYVEEGGSDLGDTFAGALMARPHFQYTNLVNSILDNTTGAVRIRPYVGQDVVEDFFTVADLGEIPGHLVGVRARSSRTKGGTATLRALNEINSGQGSELMEVALVQNPWVAQLDGSLFSGSIQEELFGVFAEDWENLQRLDRLAGQDAMAISDVLTSTRRPQVREQVQVQAEELSIPESALAVDAQSGDETVGRSLADVKNRMLSTVRHGSRLALLRWMSRE